MPTFADYAYYTAHGGTLPEAAYNAAVQDAHAEILTRTHGAAQTAPAEMQDAVKLCECALVDIIAGYKDAVAALPRGLASVSNDGYTVTAGAGDTDNVQAKECKTVCERYLAWPVNLLCGWL